MAPPRLSARTVVITGASSGVGRAAALAFADERANLVLVSRRLPVLEELADECRARGARAEAVAADVGEAEAMAQVVERALESFGGIDVWINNAGVGAVGEFCATPVAVHERVIRTNLLGCLNGAHAVLPHFKARGCGVLINTLSLGAWAASPYGVAYSASKFALRGFSEALRGELAQSPDTYPGIHVCDVYPAFLDTPGISHAANLSGREIRPVPPLYDPRRVARAMVRLALHPKKSVTVGGAATAVRLAHGMAPALSVGLMARLANRWFAHAAPAERSTGTLFESTSGEARIDGGWRRQRSRSQPSAAGVLLFGVALALFLGRERRR